MIKKTKKQTWAWGKWQEVVIRAQQRGENARLSDLPSQRPLHDNNGRRWTVMCEQRDQSEHLRRLSTGISTAPYIRSLPLPATSVSLVAVDSFISGESERRTTGRKLSEAFVLQATSLFPVKIALSLSGSCHLFFNHFRLLCSRRAINILMQSRWGDPVIGMHLVLNRGYCLSRAHHNTASHDHLIFPKTSVAVCASVKHTQNPHSPLQHCRSTSGY